MESSAPSRFSLEQLEHLAGATAVEYGRKNCQELRADPNVPLAIEDPDPTDRVIEMEVYCPPDPVAEFWCGYLAGLEQEEEM